MGSIELTLLLRYGVPLAIKLIANGKTKNDAVVTAGDAAIGLAADIDLAAKLVDAKPKQVKSIVDGLFDVITGASDAFSHLVVALVGLLKD